jgi:hypothetical protein
MSDNTSIAVYSFKFPESPMRKILERVTHEARAEVPDLEAIIEKEEQACAERIEAQIRPILVKEFRRVAKRYKVERVIFGNGTCLVVWDDKKWLAEYHPREEWPKGLRRLVALCESVASTYPTFDITHEDLK